MSTIEQSIHQVRKFQQRRWLLRCLSVATFLSSIVAVVLSILHWWLDASFNWQWIVAALLAGPVVGALYAVARACKLRDAAVAIDRTFNLKDRTQTAWVFLSRNDRDTLHDLQIADTETHLKKIDLNRLKSTDRNRLLPYSVAFTAFALAMLFISKSTPVAEGAVVSNPTVISVAQKAAEQLKELEEFKSEELDEELVKLVKELKQQIEALQQPGLDPKEALAKLSEMELSLKEVEQQLQESTMQSQIEKIGEALSLSEAMSKAGEAMAKGDMEKAAEQLAKLDMPKLDLKTEKAIKEKLDQVSKNESGAKPNKSTQLKEATDKLCEGISSGNRNKFKEGAEGLAGECKKQGQKKKLTDLLRKQCQCLSECKSECEGECQNQSVVQSKKKGGKNAGLAASGNEAGEKTAKLATNPQMDIKGQDSGQGDVDIETEESGEQEQQATRQYRERIKEYEALSETALNSESIPLGQRQTIRKYFESIRPQNEDLKKIDKATAAE
jgi:hypothetical protein